MIVCSMLVMILSVMSTTSINGIAYRVQGARLSGGAEVALCVTTRQAYQRFSLAETSAGEDEL